VRHERWNDHIPAALAARDLPSIKVPYIDGWLKGWRIWILLHNPVAFIVGNWRFLRAAREFRPTHIHAFNHLHVLSFLPSLVLLRTPVIYRSGGKPIMHRWIWRMLWRFVVARTCCFVAVSKFIARELKATGVKPERIVVIYGIPPNRVGNEAESTIPILDRTTRDIVFVGQITKNKGPHVLIQAFRGIIERYAQARVLIAGRISDWSGDNWARNLRESVACDPALRSRIVFLGHIENIPELLRGRELLVAPSIFEEPLGLVVMEAKAAGIPSIVFPSGGLPEMIQHGVDGFVCRDKSVEALIDALKVYLENPLIAAQEGVAAQASLERLGIPKFGSRWLSVYENYI
jgi:glycosyltransferase involved in cell wall biosynthesis